MISNRFRALAVVAASLLVQGAAASAQTYYSMTGRAATGSGLTVRLPATGVACPSITGATKNVTNPAGHPVTQTNLNTGIVLNPKGCIPGGPALVSANTTGGFEMPVNFFSQPYTGMLRVVPVPLTPAVVQLATSFRFQGPATSPVEPLNAAKGGTFPYADFRNLRHGAWTTQTGRAGLNFTACARQTPNVACTTPGQGNIPAIVKYTGGPGGGFGGTMGLVLTTGPSNVSNLAVRVPLGLGGNTLGVVVLAGMGSRAAGRGYAAYDYDLLASGELWRMYVLTMNTPSGLISMVTSPLGVIGAGLNKNYGFPFTTGNVIVRGTGATQGGAMAAGGTFSINGFDTTSMGDRNIQLVAGHLAQSTVQGPNGTPNYTVLRLNLPEPGAALQLGAGVLGLLGMAAWRSRRSR